MTRQSFPGTRWSCLATPANTVSYGRKSSEGDPLPHIFIADEPEEGKEEEKARRSGSVVLEHFQSFSDGCGDSPTSPENRCHPLHGILCESHTTPLTAPLSSQDQEQNSCKGRD